MVSAFLEAGVRPPRNLLCPMPIATPARLDHNLVAAISQLVRRTSMSMSDLVALWRGETPADSRPNKALDPTWLSILLHDYPLRHHVIDAASHGVTHIFHEPRPPDLHPVDNHGSAKRYSNALERSLAEGQYAGTYLVVHTADALAWKRVRFSPFGCVPKKDVDPSIEARLIHDLSFPRGLSVNARSQSSQFPSLLFESVRRLACRIEELAVSFDGSQITMLKGDVKSAFRHIPVSSSLAAHFVGSFRHDLTVIDLSLPFGWTGSPAHYGAFGSAISFLVARESPRSLDPSEDDDTPFFSFVWVDDHILIEPDVGRRPELAEAALRVSMMAILGPNAINDKKFSSWETTLQALGLVWDTTLRTVSMPADKIAKALLRLGAAVSRGMATKHQLAKLLGSLRHVGLCCRATRAFFQRLHGTWLRAPSIGNVHLSDDEIYDLLWIDTLLRQGGTSSIPTSVLADTLEPAIHLFMDASNDGLCVLYPAVREYIRVRFDDDERRMISNASPKSTESRFSINVRETLSAAFAVLIWGPRWSKHGRQHHPVHVRCWIDNVSAVSWIHRHHSRNSYGQELTRVLSCAELKFNLFVSTAHLEGSRNTLADLGSRGWSGGTIRVPEDLRTRIIELQWRSLADTSRSQYLRTWKQWCDFCAAHKLPQWLSDSNTADQSLQLTMFAVGCWLQHGEAACLRFDTVRNKLSHIRWCHQLVAGTRPQLEPQHELVLDAMRRLSPPSQARSAVSFEMLETITAGGNMRIPIHRVICGAAVLGFFFCLRGSEYLQSRGRQRHRYCLQVADVVVVNSTGQPTSNFNEAETVKLTLRGSKTDQVGRSQTRELTKSGRAPVCPVHAALLLLTNARILGASQNSPLCSHAPNHVLSTEIMTTVLKKAAARCGQDPSSISTHSLRVGGATAMHAADVNSDAIRMHGRWASDTYQRYIREAPATTTRLAERMGRASSTVNLSASARSTTRGSTRSSSRRTGPMAPQSNRHVAPPSCSR